MIKRKLNVGGPASIELRARRYRNSSNFKLSFWLLTILQLFCIIGMLDQINFDRKYDNNFERDLPIYSGPILVTFRFFARASNDTRPDLGNQCPKKFCMSSSEGSPVLFCAVTPEKTADIYFRTSDRICRLGPSVIISWILSGSSNLEFEPAWGSHRGTIK
jgi:hypothetical protein